MSDDKKDVKTKKVEAPKDNELFFEKPVPETDAYKYLTEIAETKLGISNHTAVSFRSDRGKLMIGLLPNGKGG